MKKFIKTISTICLVLLMAVPMMLLAGCSKNYTIEIIVDGGNGGVFKHKTEVSVIGKNTVEGDEKFEYSISPYTGNEIESIFIDGVKQEVTSPSGMWLYFDNITENHTVVVKFKPIECTVLFMCRNDADTDYIEFKRISVNYNANIHNYIEQYGGANNKLWYTLSGEDKIYTYNGSKNLNDPLPSDSVANTFYIGSVGTTTLYTDMTKTQLEALISQN